MDRYTQQQQPQQQQLSDNDALSHSTSGGLWSPTPAPYSCYYFPYPYYSSQPLFAVPNSVPNQVTVERMADVQVPGFGLRKEDYNVSEAHSSSSPHSSSPTPAPYCYYFPYPYYSSQPLFVVPNSGPNQVTVERMADVQVPGFGLRKEDYNVSKAHSSSSPHSSSPTPAPYCYYFPYPYYSCQPPFAAPNSRPNLATVERLADVQHSEHNPLMLDAKIIKNLNPVYLDETIMTFRQTDGPFRRHSVGNHDQLMPVLAIETYKIVDAFEEASSMISALVSKRKSLFDELLTVKGSINVFCRARPVSAGEGPYVFNFPNDFTIRICTGEDSAYPKKDFEFDRVYKPDVTQEIIFADVMPFVRSALDGCDVTMFAFGQTGSGKTHTMLGSNKDAGLYDRCFNYLIYLSNRYANKKTMRFEFFVSVCGIHHDQFRDFLSDDSVVEPLRVKVHEPDDFSRLLEKTFDPTNDLKKGKFTHVFVTIHICSSNLISGEKIQVSSP